MISKFLRLIAFAVVIFLVPPAGAQDSEAPLGMHPQGGQTHWYDRACCNLNDCARVNVRLEDGYYVWNSWTRPGVVLRLPFGSSEVKPSQDTSFHGCENKHIAPQVLDPDNDYLNGVYCLYVPPAM